MMQSKGAKIAYIIILVIFGLGLYWVYTGPMAKQKLDRKQDYKNYIKTEATIVDQQHNGKIGKGSATIWTLAFMDNTGTKRTVTLQQNSFLGKDNGEKIIIYYDSTNYRAITSEASYNEVMN